MIIQPFRRADLVAQPWKNGGGFTREVVCRPAGSGMAHFDWRVSIAYIGGSGPFSAFPGIDRVITLLEGPGVHLRSHDGAIGHRLDRALEPFAFPGEANVHADLLGAECHDFNVMTRRSACTAQVQVLRGAMELPAAREGLLLAARGDWQIQGPAPRWLGPGEGLWWHAAGAAWHCNPRTPDAALIAVLIEPQHP